jgi:hypothetical protein
VNSEHNSSTVATPARVGPEPCSLCPFLFISLLSLYNLLTLDYLKVFCLSLSRFLYTKVRSRNRGNLSAVRSTQQSIRWLWHRPLSGRHAVADDSQTVACFEEKTPGGYAVTTAAKRWLWPLQQHATSHSGVCDVDRFVAEIQNKTLTSQQRVSCQASCVSVTMIPGGSHSHSLGFLF